MIKHPTNKLDRLQVAIKRSKLSKDKSNRPTHVKRRAKLEVAEKEAVDALHGEFLE